VATVWLSTTLWAEDQKQEPEAEPPFSFSFDTTLVSKFMWRGQRLTDGWNQQSAGTFGVKSFSVNVWTKMDLQALNEGDTSFLSQNPDFGGLGGSGLRGKFSEVDLTFSYAKELSKATITGGAITYIFPYTSYPSTTEVFGRLSFDSVPLAPAVTVNVDVDESRGRGDTGLYLELAGSHSVPLSSKHFKSVDISGRLGVAGSGFSNLCYKFDHSGLHDAGLSVSLPVAIGKGWSSTLFVSYASLLGGFRDYQYVNLPAFYRGTAGPPSSYADTVWGGITFAFAR